MDRDILVAFVMPIFGSSPAAITESTPPAVIARPFNPHANWRGLPDHAVAGVLDRLPVLDLFRLGYLFSPRWLHIWRSQPLYLHDRQFATPPIAADDVADAITHVLELHVGDGVQFVAGEGGGGGDAGVQAVGGEGGGDEVAAADAEDLGIIVNPGGGAVHNDDGGGDHDGGLDVVDDEASEDGGGVVDDAGQGVAAVGIDEAAAGGIGGGGQGEGEGVGADDGVISDDDIYGNDDIPHGGYEIGRVYTFRVETTRWRPDHLDRWFAALQRGHARDISLANLAIEGRPHLPPAIRDCTSLKGLHVFFFTVVGNHIDPLVKLRSLGLYACTGGHGLIERALRPESEIQELIIYHSKMESMAVVATRLRYLTMCDVEVVGAVVVDDAIQFRELYMYPARPSKLSIKRAPSLRDIISLDILNTVLEIQGIVIQAGMVEQAPKMRSLRHLHLRVNYTEMGDRVPREIEQILRSFPCLETLEIMRDDEVTEVEGLLQANDEHIYEGNNFFHDLDCFNHHLKWTHLIGFRGGRYELALVKSILDKVKARTQLKLEYSPDSYADIDNIQNQFYSALRNFRSTTPNDAVRDERVLVTLAWNN